jgi:hypothetical protein
MVKGKSMHSSTSAAPCCNLCRARACIAAQVPHLVVISDAGLSYTIVRPSGLLDAAPL